MDTIEFQWLEDQPSLKEALQSLLGCSGQHLKRYFSNKDQSKSVKAKETIRLPLDFVNHMSVNPHYEGPETKILKETDDFLAIHKPPGIHCHPLIYSDQDTLLNSLVQMKKWGPLFVNQKQYDRGLLYRLDNETSGVMVMAKNEETFQRIRQDFESQMKGKYYWAIVDSGFNADGEWTHYLRSTGVKGAKQKVSNGPHELATPGSLKVIKLLENKNKSLLLIKLKTGLRHQIRAQLAALNFPILGDELYGGKRGKRLFLHAFRYEWGNEIVEDSSADLFEDFFDLNSALQMSHDMIRLIQGR